MKKEWQVKDVSKTCCRCGREFADRQPYHSMLVIHPDDLVTLVSVRSDACQECWPQVRQEIDANAAGAVERFQWRAVYQKSAPVDRGGVRKGRAEALLQYLREHGGESDRRGKNLLFAIAVTLERKRVLVPCPGEGDAGGGPVLLYRHARGEDTFLVERPVDIGQDKDYINETIRGIVDGQGS